MPKEIFEFLGKKDKKSNKAKETPDKARDKKAQKEKEMVKRGRDMEKQTKITSI